MTPLLFHSNRNGTNSLRPPTFRLTIDVISKQNKLNCCMIERERERIKERRTENLSTQKISNTWFTLWRELK